MKDNVFEFVDGDARALFPLVHVCQLEMTTTQGGATVHVEFAGSRGWYHTFADREEALALYNNLAAAIAAYWQEAER